MGGKRFKSSKIHMDKISELPDEILFVILCMLTMKEAGRTSILSHRWRYLWEISLASSSNLILDVIAMRGIEYPEDVAKLMRVECPYNSLRSERCKFARFIQPILHLDHCSPKELCSLRFYLDGGYAHLIDKFIKLALAKRCRNLEIDLRPFGGACDACYLKEKYYKFPSHFPTQEIGSSVKRLCLKACNLMFFRSKIFNSLVDLHLEFALMDDVRILRVLSNCPGLKKLCLVKCNHLRRLKITGPSLKLKCLTVVFCEGLRKIKIDSETLTNFNYCGDRIKITFLKVPQLANVILRPRSAKGALSYALRNLSSDLPHLEYLFLAVQSIEKRKIPRQLPIFANLKKLVLCGLFCNTNLWAIILLLQASPNITRLELNVLTSNIKYGDRPSNFHHRHLEEIVLSGFSGRKGHIEFAKYLLNSAITLKKFTIFRKFIIYEHVTGDVPKIVKENIERLEKQKAGGCGKEEPIVWDSLVEVARPGVELVIDRVNYASGARVNYERGAMQVVLE